MIAYLLLIVILDLKLILKLNLFSKQCL